jgi:hypothetical protein
MRWWRSLGTTNQIAVATVLVTVLAAVPSYLGYLALRDGEVVEPSSSSNVNPATTSAPTPTSEATTTSSSDATSTSNVSQYRHSYADIPLRIPISHCGSGSGVDLDKPDAVTNSGSEFDFENYVNVGCSKPTSPGIWITSDTGASLEASASSTPEHCSEAIARQPTSERFRIRRGIFICFQTIEGRIVLGRVRDITMADGDSVLALVVTAWERDDP